MAPETPPTNTDLKIEPQVAAPLTDRSKTIDYSRRFRNIITLSYVTIGVILLSFFAMYLWGATGTLGSAAIALILMMLMLAIGGTPVLIIVSLYLLVTCLRYLVLDRLSGGLRTVAIVTSIVSVALLVACGLYFVTYANIFTL